MSIVQEMPVVMVIHGWSVSEPERDLHTPFKKTKYKDPLLICSGFVHRAFLRPEGGVACPGEAAGPRPARARVPKRARTALTGRRRPQTGAPGEVPTVAWPDSIHALLR